VRDFITTIHLFEMCFVKKIDYRIFEANVFSFQ